MAPSRNTRRNTNKNIKNKKRMNRSRLGNMPPALTINAHHMRSRIQTAWDISQGSITASKSHYIPGAYTVPTQDPSMWNLINVTLPYLFAHGWLEGLKKLFNQVKVHRITANYVPYAPITDPGEYIFGLWDFKENASPTSFSSLLGTPASVVKKIGQPSRLTWHPTEPDDRNWFELSSLHQFCSVAVYSAEDVYNQDVPAQTSTVDQQHANVAGKIIITVDASFRGKPSTIKGVSQCTCSKCLRALFLSRPSLRGLLEGFTIESVGDSGPSSPYVSPDVPI